MLTSRKGATPLVTPVWARLQTQALQGEVRSTPPPPEVRRNESWLQAFHPSSSRQQKTVEARKDPKDLGRYEAQQRERFFLRTTFWGCELSGWWLGVFLVQGDFRLMPQSEWQRIYGRFEAVGDFSPVVLWLVGFLLLQKNPTGRPHPEKRSPCDRCQR